MKFDLPVRPIVSRGDVLPIRISWSQLRGGKPFILSHVTATIDVSGAFTVSVAADSLDFFDQNLPVLVTGTDLFKLPDGPQTVRVTLDLEFDDSFLFRRRIALPASLRAELLARHRAELVERSAVVLTGQWTMGPPEGPVLLRSDRALASAQRASVGAQFMAYGPSAREGLMLTVNRPPIGFAADVFVRVPYGEWTRAGSFSAPAGERLRVRIPWPSVPRTTKFDVMLSPNVWVARQSLFPLHEIWGEEVELHDAGTEPFAARP